MRIAQLADWTIMQTGLQLYKVDINATIIVGYAWQLKVQ